MIVVVVVQIQAVLVNVGRDVVLVAAALVEQWGAKPRGAIREIPTVDQVAVVGKADHGRMAVDSAAIVARAIQARVRVGKHVAVRVGLAATLADVLVARVHLADPFTPLALVVLRHPVGDPVDHRAYAGAIGQPVRRRPDGLARIAVSDGARIAAEGRAAVKEVDVIGAHTRWQVDDIEWEEGRPGNAHRHRQLTGAVSDATDGGTWRVRHIVEIGRPVAGLARRSDDEPLVVAIRVLDAAAFEHVRQKCTAANASGSLRAGCAARALGGVRRRQGVGLVRGSRL